MFRVNLYNTSHKIVFRHNTKETPQTTDCLLVTTVDGERITEKTATAIVSEHDQYSKAMGRKVSLTKLLKELDLTKEERKEVWDAYHKVSAKWQ